MLQGRPRKAYLDWMLIHDIVIVTEMNPQHYLLLLLSHTKLQDLSIFSIHTSTQAHSYK